MSISLQGPVIDELLHEGRYLYPSNVVAIIERHHPQEGPGVPRSLVDSYVEHVLYDLGNRAPYSLQRFASLFDDRVTDATIWVPNALYRLGSDRFSVYPPWWHDRLSGVRDPVEYVTVISEDMDRARGAAADAAPSPVPKQLLIAAMIVLGRMDRRTAGGLVQNARLAGRIRVDPVQNPDADVRVVPFPTPRPSSRAEPVRPAEADSTVGTSVGPGGRGA